MDCMSRNLGCFFHKPADKLCIAGNVTRDRKLADCDSEFHINQETANAAIEPRRASSLQLGRKDDA
jgi:hypothetical protein